MNTAPCMLNSNMSGDEWVENNPWIAKRDPSQLPRCTNAYLCMLCSCSLSSVTDIKSHLLGSRHDNNLKKQEKMIGACKPKTQLRNEAQICDPRPLSNNPELIAILNSEMDAQGQKLPGLEFIFTNGKGKEMSFDCALCQMRMNSKTVLISHLLGMKHCIAYLEAIDEESLNQIKEQCKEKSIFAITVRRVIDWHLKNQTNHVNKQSADCQSPQPTPQPTAGQRTEKIVNCDSSNTSNHVEETSEPKTTEGPTQDNDSLCAVSNETKETICDFITYCDLVTWAQRSKIKTKAEEASALKLINIFLEQIFCYRTRTVPEQFQKLLYKAVLENDYPQMNSILNHVLAAKK